MKPIVNIAGYKFVELDDLAQRRKSLLDLCKQLEIKGTILLSREGVNVFLAGTRHAIDSFRNQLRRDPLFQDFSVKESRSDEQPFSRLLVRIKKEIIAFGVDDIQPSKCTSPKIAPRKLKSWLDYRKPVTLLDVRNNYEVEIGTFENALAIDVDHFRDFPNAVKKLPDECKVRPLVMFCTGGIRCEKAGPLMEQMGFQNVYQLDGGILQYFEDCGGAHYQGECFVFDKRVALDPELKETETTVCFACQHVLQPSDLESSSYVPGSYCPFCFRTDQQKMRDLLRERNQAIEKITCPLPGSVAYVNVRPLNVPRRYDGSSLIEFLSDFHPHVSKEKWLQAINSGNLTLRGQSLAVNDTVTAGQRIEHTIPATTEPAINPRIEILFEDQWIVAVDKPAPLPMHPSGRFNRNTLISILNSVYQRPLRIVHRLDANTTGIVVFAKGRCAAAHMQRQFEQQRVKKVYVARVHGHLDADALTLNYRITDEAGLGGSRTVHETGQDCSTICRVLQRMDDDTTLLEVRPKTGRTNQIRVHLWQAGFPIVGDPTYGTNRQISDRQTLDISDSPMCLHACQIEVVHPEQQRPSCFETRIPDWAVPSSTNAIFE